MSRLDKIRAEFKSTKWDRKSQLSQFSDALFVKEQAALLCKLSRQLENRVIRRSLGG